MSRSNNTELTNPSKRFFEWNGDAVGFKYFDKTLGEKGEKVPVPLPFRFLVLDTLSCIKGFSDADQSGYWSNEIRDIKTDELVVRTKKGIAAKGVYEKVISLPDTTGSKYCQSVYIGYMLGDKMEICNIAIVGAALGAWIEFRKKNKSKIYEGAVTVNEMLDGKKGNTNYKIPVFKMIDITPEKENQAKELDKELQTFLSLYLKKNATTSIEQTSETIAIKEVAKEEINVPSMAGDAPPESVYVSDPNDDLPF